MSDLKQTALHDVHLRYSARMVEFAGYSMPVQYTSILEEHAAVRNAAGLFDVSHMGQIGLQGANVVESLERLVSRSVASQRPGRVRYALLCNEQGGVVDDVTVYRLARDAFFLCVNAANVAKDLAWTTANALAGTDVRDCSEETGLLALQGPASVEILARVSNGSAAALRRYAFDRIEVAGVTALVSRTGYTGSDGFEIYVGNDVAEKVFETLLAEGKSLGIQPVGLGARDTLRLEAAMALYGHELDEETSPLAAGLDRFVDLAAGGFIGAEAINRRREGGHRHVLVGFELTERGVARADYPVAVDSEVIGRVTSGAPSPTLGKSIGLAYVPPGCSDVGARFDVVIRGRATPAVVVETPFVKG